MQFVNRDDVPALVQAAVGQPQFESIHPFTDGKGRIGRALINAILRRRGATTRMVILASRVGIVWDVMLFQHGSFPQCMTAWKSTGVDLGDYLDGQIDARCAEIRVPRQDLAGWRPSPPTRGRRGR